uniref:VWFD domain-containing protein n=1 Tax=Strigamia maritima TaxID=126957 RepID=T1JEF6_STRMM
MTDNHQCLPTDRCQDENKSNYLNGAKWIGKCQLCECWQGRINCTEDACLNESANCTVLPTNQYRTFDNDNSINITTSCRHILARDCSEDSFTVLIQKFCRIR